MKTKIQSSERRWLSKAKKRMDEKQIHFVRLLIRNEMFNTELAKIKKTIGKKFFSLRKKIKDLEMGRILCNTNYPELKKAIREHPDRNFFEGMAETEKLNNMLPEQLIMVWTFNEFRKVWGSFCKRWSIKDSWNGNLNSLWMHVVNPIEVHCDEDQKLRTKHLSIEINKWTTLKDIRQAWKNKIEPLQKRQLGKIETRSNFERDLLWYDLNKNIGYSVSKIAKQVIHLDHHIINILVTKRIRKTIDPEDIKQTVLDDEELLRAVTSGFLAEKYRSDFEEERRIFTDARSGAKLRSTGISHLQDIIKKAIKRMEEQIAEFNISSPNKSADGFAPYLWLY